MAAAGEHPRPLPRDAAKEGAPGGDHGGARRGGRALHPLAGRRAGLQGLPRLPRLDLRLAQLDGGARHPGPLRAASRGDILSIDIGVILDGWVADAAITHPIGNVTPVATRLLATTRASLFDAVEQCRPGNRLGDVSHAVQARVEAEGFVGDPLARGPRHRPRHARGPADPQLRGPRHRAGARGGDGAGHRADGQRRQPTRCAWAPTTGPCTRRTARWPPTSSTRWPSRPTGPRILTPWHELVASRPSPPRRRLSRRRAPASRVRTDGLDCYSFRSARGRFLGPALVLVSIRPGQRSYEGPSISQAHVREVQDHPPRRCGPRDLPEPPSQAAAGVTRG